MTSYAKRLLIAAALSVTGFAMSWLFFGREPAKDRVEGKRLATLESAKNEVQRRPAKRVIWERVDENEALYSGEAVRTAPDAEAKILFNSGAEVDLDPDSVVVIQDAGDKLALDFIKGNLVVKGGTDSGNLALKSGDATIDVSNAQIALNKSGDKNLDVQVLNGTAQISSGEKSMTLAQGHTSSIGDKGIEQAANFFKVKSPIPNQSVYIRADSGARAKFEFEKVSDDYDVHVDYGSSREESALKYHSSSFAGSKGYVETPLKPGTVYWRLVAMNKKNRKQVVSLVSKIKVLADFPPKLISPSNNKVVTIAKDDHVSFNWANPSRLVNLHLRIYRNPKFKGESYKDIPLEKLDMASLNFDEEGDFYWYVIGSHEGMNDSSVSEAFKFTVRRHFELVSPEMRLPLPSAHLSYESVNGGGNFFTWVEVPGVSLYRIKVSREGDDKTPVVDETVEDITQFKMPQLKAGKYQWVVTSKDEEGKESPAPAYHVFSVTDVPKVQWPDSARSETYEYVTSAPTVKPRWIRDLGGLANKYRVSVKGENFEKVDETGAPEKIFELPKDGLYHVTVEALDVKGLVIAKSSVRDFLVAPLPLLSPPKFAERMPATVQALNNGSAVFGWNPVNGARAYTMTIKDVAGKTIKQEKFGPASSGTLKSLLPGQYKVSLSTVDQFNRTGPSGEEKTLVVPAVSDARPPGFKKLKIE